MSEPETPLRGGCSCGRNVYKIVIPAKPSSSITPTVLFDESSETLGSQPSPLPVFLRVPLDWLQSTTYAFYPNETHTEIRRVFIPRHVPHTKRHFCGFCGTPLTIWSERDSEEAEWVRVNLSSLEGASMSILDDMGILSLEESSGDADAFALGHDGSVGQEMSEGGAIGSAETRSVARPWFDQVLEGSELGKTRRTRGGKTSQDGTVKIEWEIVEYDGDANDDGMGAQSTLVSVKRKLDSLIDQVDVDMKSGN